MSFVDFVVTYIIDCQALNDPAYVITWRNDFLPDEALFTLEDSVWLSRMIFASLFVSLEVILQVLTLL